MSSPHSKIRQQRAKLYGDVEFGHRNLGRIWGAILSQHLQIAIPDIPPHIVALMMASLKVSRASFPFAYSQDHYDDLRNYTDFAQETVPKKERYSK